MTFYLCRFYSTISEIELDDLKSMRERTSDKKYIQDSIGISSAEELKCKILQRSGSFVGGL